MSEIKDIPDMGGYRASSCGKIFFKNKELGTSRGGYKRKYLRVSIKNKKYYVHRLVLSAFKGGCPKGMQACHGNGNPTDNRIENLRWDTPLRNSRDKILHGTSGKGQQNAMAKLSDEDADMIVSQYYKFTSTEMASRFSVSRSTIVLIATGRGRFKKNSQMMYLYNKKIGQQRIKRARDDANKKRKYNACRC